MTHPSDKRPSSTLAAFKRHEPLPEAIAGLVAQAVATRSLAPGARIVETALAAEIGVSRVPVREALAILHTQGIIEGGGHRGYRVASFSDKMVNSIQEMRLELETLFLHDAVAAWRGGTASFGGLEAPIAAMHRAARIGDVADMLRADVAFHTAICEAADNAVFAMLWTAMSRHVLIILNLARFRDIDLWIVVRRHEALRDQIEAVMAGRMPEEALRGLLEAHFLAERSGSASAE